MAYSFLTKVQPTEPGELDNFSTMSKDGSRGSMGFGSGPQTVDITGSPNASPLTVSNSAPTTLLIPLNAVQVNFIALTNTVNISESVSAVTSKYFTIPTGVQITIDVTRCSTLYLEANTGASTLSFWFNIV